MSKSYRFISHDSLAKPGAAGVCIDSFTGSRLTLLDTPGACPLEVWTTEPPAERALARIAPRSSGSYELLRPGHCMLIDRKDTENGRLWVRLPPGGAGTFSGGRASAFLPERIASAELADGAATGAARDASTETVFRYESNRGVLLVMDNGSPLSAAENRDVLVLPAMGYSADGKGGGAVDVRGTVRMVTSTGTAVQADMQYAVVRNPAAVVPFALLADYPHVYLELETETNGAATPVSVGVRDTGEATFVLRSVGPRVMRGAFPFGGLSVPTELDIPFDVGAGARALHVIDCGIPANFLGMDGAAPDNVFEIVPRIETTNAEYLDSDCLVRGRWIFTREPLLAGTVFHLEVERDPTDENAFGHGIAVLPRAGCKSKIGVTVSTNGAGVPLEVRFTPYADPLSASALVPSVLLQAIAASVTPVFVEFDGPDIPGHVWFRATDTAISARIRVRMYGRS